MCLKLVFAKQVPVTEWPSAKALPSTPLLLNVFGMWEKLVTPGRPIHCTTSVTSEVWAFQRQSRAATQLRAPQGDALSRGRALNKVKRAQKGHLWNLWRLLPLPSALPPPSPSLLSLSSFLPSFSPLFLTPSLPPPPPSLSLPPLLLFNSSLPSSLPPLAFSLILFFILFCFWRELCSKCIKIIIKYSWGFLGLGSANLDFSADQAFWFFLTKENQIFCVP